MCPQSEKEFRIQFSIIIFLELLCGLVGNVISAFCNAERQWSAYLIFALHLIFVVGITFGVVKVLGSSDHRTPTVTISRMCSFCTAITLVLFLSIFLIVKPQPKVNQYYILGALIACIVVMIWLALVEALYYYSSMDDAEMRFGARPVAVHKTVDKMLVDGIPEDPGQRSVDQSLALMIDNVRNNPTKSYKMSTGQDFFEVVM